MGIRDLLMDLGKRKIPGAHTLGEAHLRLGFRHEIWKEKPKWN